MSQELEELKELIVKSQAKNFEDLKQYIDVRFSRHELRFDRVERAVEELRQDMRSGFLAVGDAIDELGADIDKRFSNHERRISHLESAT